MDLTPLIVGLALGLGLVAAMSAAVRANTDECPHCKARIPREATACHRCGRGVL